MSETKKPNKEEMKLEEEPTRSMIEQTQTGKPSRVTKKAGLYNDKEDEEKNDDVDDDRGDLKDLRESISPFIQSKNQIRVTGKLNLYLYLYLYDPSAQHIV